MALQYSNEDLLAVMRRVGQTHGRPISTRAWEKHGYRPTTALYRERFGSWKDAWRQAGMPEDMIPAKKERTLYRDCEQAIRDAYAKFKRVLTLKEWTELGLHPDTGTIRRRCGGWRAAWAIVGERAKRRPWSNEEMLEAMRKRYAEYGRALTRQEWEENQYHPCATGIVKRFGSWAGAWVTAVGEYERAKRRTRLVSLFQLIDIDWGILSQRERWVVTGILNGTTLENIGAAVGVGPEAVRQIAERTFLRLVYAELEKGKRPMLRAR